MNTPATPVRGPHKVELFGGQVHPRWGGVLFCIKIMLFVCDGYSLVSELLLKLIVSQWFSWSQNFVSFVKWQSVIADAVSLLVVEPIGHFSRDMLSDGE